MSRQDTWPLLIASWNWATVASTSGKGLRLGSRVTPSSSPPQAASTASIRLLVPKASQRRRPAKNVESGVRVIGVLLLPPAPAPHHEKNRHAGRHGLNATPVPV